MVNNTPLVSVIVTTYNRKKLLKETIDSIFCLEYGVEVYEISKEGIPAKMEGIAWIDFLLVANAFEKTKLCSAKESKKGV